MGVLTGGLFGLSFEPFTRTVVPGSVPYETVYDSGAAQIVIKVPETIAASELEATLQQAAANLLKPSRLAIPGQAPTIRARSIVHQAGGVSKLLYLGQVSPTATNGTASVSVTLNADAFSELSSTLSDDA